MNGPGGTGVGDTVLDVVDLSVFYNTNHVVSHVVKNVNFSLARKQTLAIVGESGSGKSSMAMAIARLLPESARVAGRVELNGRNLLEQSARALEDIRGSEIAVIFQNPMTSLNPTMRVGQQIAEQVLRHRTQSRAVARRRAAELLEAVMIRNPADVYRKFPHELSGGMKQRVMIAMAVSCEPKVLIADEPTTALDVTVQAEILQILRLLSRDQNMGLLLITHNMGIVAEMATDVAVIYDGRMAEYASVEDLFREPLHPYTRGLLDARPRIDDAEARTRRLSTISRPAPKLDGVVEGYRLSEGTGTDADTAAGRPGEVPGQRFISIGDDLVPVVRESVTT